jgi:hypothetical protein
MQSALHPDVLATLREIVELGAFRLHQGRVQLATLPAVNLYVSTRWNPTLDTAEWMARRGQLPDGEYFVCLFDGWREWSRYVPPSGRKVVRWEEIADRSRFRGSGAAGEPRFVHDPTRPELYPKLCRPVLGYARHRGDADVILLPDPEFVTTRGYEAARNEAEAVSSATPQPSARLGQETPLYWRGSPNTDPLTFGHASPPARVAVVDSSCRPSLDAQFVPHGGPRVPIRTQILASPLQLDLDGMVGAWSGRFWKLIAHGVVPVRPETPWEQWFEHRLRAGEHYVHVGWSSSERSEGGTSDPERSEGVPQAAGHSLAAPSPAALENARQWCLAHPERCDQIARAGSVLARTLLDEHADLLGIGRSLRPLAAERPSPEGAGETKEEASAAARESAAGPGAAGELRSEAGRAPSVAKELQLPPDHIQPPITFRPSSTPTSRREAECLRLVEQAPWVFPPYAELEAIYAAERRHEDRARVMLHAYLRGTTPDVRPRLATDHADLKLQPAHQRHVLKVLSEEWADDPERVADLYREAASVVAHLAQPGTEPEVRQLRIDGVWRCLDLGETAAAAELAENVGGFVQYAAHRFASPASFGAAGTSSGSIKGEWKDAEPAGRRRPPDCPSSESEGQYPRLNFRQTPGQQPLRVGYMTFAPLTASRLGAMLSRPRRTAVWWFSFAEDDGQDRVLLEQADVAVAMARMAPGDAAQTIDAAPLDMLVLLDRPTRPWAELPDMLARRPHIDDPLSMPALPPLAWRSEAGPDHSSAEELANALTLLIPEPDPAYHPPLFRSTLLQLVARKPSLTLRIAQPAAQLYRVQGRGDRAMPPRVAVFEPAALPRRERAAVAVQTWPRPSWRVAAFAKATGRGIVGGATLSDIIRNLNAAAQGDQHGKPAGAAKEVNMAEDLEVYEEALDAFGPPSGATDGGVTQWDAPRAPGAGFGQGAGPAQHGGFAPQQGPGPYGGFAPQQGPYGGFAPQQGPFGGFAPQQGPGPYGGFVPQQGRYGGFAPQQGPYGGFAPQQGPYGGFAPQQGPYGGFAPQQGPGPYGGFVPQQGPYGGFAPQQGPGPYGGFGPQQGPYGGFGPQQGAGRMMSQADLPSGAKQVLMLSGTGGEPQAVYVLGEETVASMLGAGDNAPPFPILTPLTPELVRLVGEKLASACETDRVRLLVASPEAMELALSLGVRAKQVGPFDITPIGQEPGRAIIDLGHAKRYGHILTGTTLLHELLFHSDNTADVEGVDGAKRLTFAGRKVAVFVGSAGQARAVAEAASKEGKPFVLVTLPAKEGRACVAEGDEAEAVLRAPHLTRWFCCGYAGPEDERVRTVPGGLGGDCAVVAELELRMRARREAMEFGGSHCAMDVREPFYLCFEESTEERRALRAMLAEDYPWHNPPGSQFSLSQHRFCACPAGPEGPDTARVWECLYLGVTPVLLRSAWTRCLEGKIPAVFVSSWEEARWDRLKVHDGKVRVPTSWDPPRVFSVGSDNMLGAEPSGAHTPPMLTVVHWRKAIVSAAGPGDRAGSVLPKRRGKR